jgi:hypothetical protein
MIEAHDAQEPRPPSKALRAVLLGLAGLGGGAVAGGLGGYLFALVYQPHGGGQIGDWTAIFALAGMALGGALLGLIGGVVCGLTGFKLWKLLAGLLGLALLVGGVLIAAH